MNRSATRRDSGAPVHMAKRGSRLTTRAPRRPTDVIRRIGQGFPSVFARLLDLILAGRAQVVRVLLQAGRDAPASRRDVPTEAFDVPKADRRELPGDGLEIVDVILAALGQIGLVGLEVCQDLVAT